MALKPTSPLAAAKPAAGGPAAWRRAPAKGRVGIDFDAPLEHQRRVAIAGDRTAVAASLAQPGVARQQAPVRVKAS